MNPLTTTATVRSGRQIEETDTTPVEGHERYSAVVSNRRFYDNDLTSVNFWGVEHSGGYVQIDRYDYSDLKNSNIVKAGN